MKLAQKIILCLVVLVIGIISFIYLRPESMETHFKLEYESLNGKNDYIDVNIPGEGMDKDGWSIYKALSGAYKYAITQTFAIPTVDDAEKSKYTENTDIQ